MNSFNFAAKGIEREIRRQIGIYEAGGTVEQETLHFDPGNESSPPLRSKEEAQDYRYFPEPDLVPISPARELVESLRAGLEELPGARIERIASALSFSEAEVLVMGGLDRLWSEVVSAGADLKQAANVLANSFLATAVDPASVDPGELARLIAARNEIPRAAFDEALARSGEPGFSADPYLEQRTVTDVATIDSVIDAVLAANSGQVAQYRAGKEGLMGFFVGQVMKRSGGSADPRVVNERLRQRLS
jgi:aspartyl-tRNA(Asn)/glutamyl-tRNA(Gln) amidotransferase subunit B